MFSTSCKLGIASDKGSSGNCQQRDVHNGVEIFIRLSVSNPKSFLGGGFESGVISLALCSQGIDRLKGNGIQLDGVPVIIRQCHIFCTACGFGTLMGGKKVCLDCCEAYNRFDV